MIDWNGLYMWAREWGIQPSEFWGMTIAEWWCEYDHRVGSGAKYAGNLTQGDVDDIMAFMNEGDEHGNTGD